MAVELVSTESESAGEKTVDTGIDRYKEEGAQGRPRLAVENESAG